MPSFTWRTVLAAGAALAMPAIIRPGWAADTVKLGCLFSSSGTMANLEGRMNYVAGWPPPSWVGRPERAKTHGKKGEHGRSSYGYIAKEPITV